MPIIFGIIFGSIVGYVISKIYEKYATPTEKARFENWVKMHHGEAGFLGVLFGLLIKSPSTIGLGAGMMYHDRKDLPKWFTGDKINNQSKYEWQLGYA